MNSFLKIFQVSFSKSHDIRAPRGGQTMLLMVVILTGSLLSIAMITSLIMLFQIRQSGDFTNSAKAIFAAETGAEWWRMSKLRPALTPASSTINSRLLTLNKSSFEVFTVPGNPNQAKIVGTAGNSKRALLVTVQNLCAPDVVLLMDRTSSVGGLGGFPIYTNHIKNSIIQISDQTTAAAKFSLITFASSVSFVSANFTAETSTISSQIMSVTRSLSQSTNIYDPIIRAVQEFSPSNNPLKDRPDSQNKDYMLLVVDDLPTIPDIPGTNPLDISVDGANTAKNNPNNIKIIVVGVNRLNSSNFTDFYRDRISSQDTNGSSLYFEADDYDQNLQTKLNEAAAAISSCP